MARLSDPIDARCVTGTLLHLRGVDRARAARISGCFGCTGCSNTAVAAGTGTVLARSVLVQRHASRGTESDGRDLRVNLLIGIVGVGLTDRTDLFVAQPLVDTRLRLTAANGQRVERGARGLGDPRVFLNHVWLQRDGPSGKLDVNATFGARVPLGVSGAEDDFGRVPEALQPGGGSWGFFVGSGLTWRGSGRQFDMELRHGRNLTNDGFRLGATTTLDTSLQWSLRGETWAGARWMGLLELNAQHVAPNERTGLRLDDTGGTRLLLSPGVQTLSRHGILDVLVQIPILNDVRGHGLHEDLTLRLGYRRRF